MNVSEENSKTQATQEQAPQAADAVAELEQRLAQAEAQAAEYLDSWRRSVAELSNARKRMQREQEEFIRNAAARVLEKLLPVMDDMDRAFNATPTDQVDTDWVNGFRMIQRKLQGVLDSENVTRIAAEGQHFDPSLHFAVTHEDADGVEEGYVIAEVAKGYKLGDKVLRPTMVRVAR